MKKLELNQMEIVEGGISRPSGQQVTCYVVGVVMGLLNPLAGILTGAICLFMD